MKISKKELLELIKEAYEELQSEGLSEVESGDEESDLEETWGGARSGFAATSRIGGRPGGGDGGRAELARIAARDAAKKSAAVKAGEIAHDEESMKKDPFKPTKTGFNRALGLAEARKLIAKIVKEELAKQTKSKK